MPENNVQNVVALLRQMRDYAQKEFKRAHATAFYGDSSCFEYQHQADAYDDAINILTSQAWFNEFYHDYNDEDGRYHD